MTHTFEHSTPMGRGLPPFNPTTVRINTTSHLADGTPIDMAAMKFALAVKPAKAFESSRKNSGQQQYPVLPANTHDIYMSSNDENNRWPDTASDSGNDVEMIGGSVNDTTKRQNLTDVFNESVEIQTEWMGTSLHLDEENLFIQADHENGGLLAMISFLQQLFINQAIAPYDPRILLDFSALFNRIGFSDMGAGYAHRALILIKAALKIKQEESKYIPKLAEHVFSAMSGRMLGASKLVIEDELKNYHAEGYIALLDGLRGCEAYWEAMTVSNTALKLFPDNTDILEHRDQIKVIFKKQSELGSKVHGLEGKDLQAATHSGKIYQKPYPWMAKELNYRTPALIRQINRQFGAEMAEVRPVVFGKEAGLEPKKAKEGENVGPCGIFATRDIKRGAIIMVDETQLGISDIPSTHLRNCEACHGALYYPYMFNPKEFVPKCCGKVAYCSAKCLKTATEGYHRFLCGKDIEWLYKLPGLRQDKHLGPTWRPIMLMRTAAVILADAEKPNVPFCHPLQHPLVARLGANYSQLAEGQIQPTTGYDWTYQNNVVAPTRLLLELGVNVFSNQVWGQDTIQTLIWRLDNNVNMATINPEPHSEDPEGKAVYMINLNPQYTFFNHSCHPNVNWHTSPPDATIDIRFAMDRHGNVHRPSESTIFCDAMRDIKNGEQLFISYVGDALGTQNDDDQDLKRDDGKTIREHKRDCLAKWMENGCGCVTCNAENENEMKDAFERSRKRQEENQETGEGGVMEM